MKSRIPASNISKQWFPCPRCQTSTPCEVITEIKSNDDICRFIGEFLNRAVCPSCGYVNEAPVRSTMTAQEDWLPAMECVPIELLDDQEVMSELVEDKTEGIHRVYSHSELHRCIEAHLRMEAHRQGIDPDSLSDNEFR